jgi:hypothetical protein
VSTYSETVRELRSPRRVTHVPRAALAPARGLLLTAGVMLPLSLGIALGRPEYGVFAALGAFPSGIAATLGEVRKQPAAVALAAVGMAVGAFVGALAAGTAPLLVLVTALFAYAAGIVGAFNNHVAAAVLQWPGALLIATSTPDGPRDAAVRGALVLAGGLGQAALVALTLHTPSPAPTASPAYTTNSAPTTSPPHTTSLAHSASSTAITVHAASSPAPHRTSTLSLHDPHPHPHSHQRRIPLPLLTLRAFTDRLTTTVRTHIGFRTEHGQHAVRLAATAAVAQSIALFLGLPHPYWAALTAVMVLKTDHVLTVRRSLDRIGGTALGVLLGLPLAALGHFGTAPLLLGAALAIALAYTVFAANYFLFALFLTGFVVVLLDLLGQTASHTVGPRLLSTLLGGVIALAASHIRPTP